MAASRRALRIAALLAAFAVLALLGTGELCAAPGVAAAAQGGGAWSPLPEHGAPPSARLYVLFRTGSLVRFWNEVGAFTYDPTARAWSSDPIARAVSPGPQVGTAVWIGRDVIAWGGLAYGPGATASDRGYRYNLTTGTWVALPVVGAPSARGGHTAVWTGHEMIIWGGSRGYGITLNDGARYDPASDAWMPMPAQ